MRVALLVIGVALLGSGCAHVPQAKAPARHDVEDVAIAVRGVLSPVDAAPNVPAAIPQPSPKRAHRVSGRDSRPPAPVQHPAPTPARTYAPPPPPSGSVPDLIRALFPSSQESIALCVAWRESRFDPHATNRQTGAAGVFQFMPRTWPVFSARAGFGGSSAYDARANVAVAAYAVAHGGWGPWGGGC